MSDEILWLILLAGMAGLATHWLLAARARPSHQSVRSLFLQHLLTACREARLLTEEDDALLVQVGPAACNIRLARLYQRCGGIPHLLPLLVRQAVHAVQQACEEPQGLPADWEQRALPLLVRSDQPAPPDAVLHPLFAPLSVGYVLDEPAAFRWITHEELAGVGVEEGRLRQVALRNLERSCNALVIETLGTLPDGRDRLIRFRTGDGLDASRLLIPSFYQRFSPRFGDSDLLVAIPTRDMLFMASAQDDVQARLFAWHLGRDLARHEYALLERPLRVTERGIRPWQQQPGSGADD